MNKFFVFLLAAIASLNGLAQECNYTNPADIRACEQLNARINQAKQSFDADYNNSVAKAETKVRQAEITRSVAPTQLPQLYHQQIPKVITPPTVQPQQIQQPVQQPLQQPQTQPKTRIHY